MFLTHGTKKIKHKTIWFLADLNNFTERKLYIFEFIDQKVKIITVLVEKDKLTGEVFSQRNKGQKANDIIERERIRILFTSDDIKVQKGKPYGWIYGENKEIHNRKGQVVAIKVKACDFYGQKETIKCVDVAL
ncbi:hypothetical protein IJD34_00020 [bacterium]|nr:hypothetical protein [bacterium]